MKSWFYRFCCENPFHIITGLFCVASATFVWLFLAHK